MSNRVQEDFVVVVVAFLIDLKHLLFDQCNDLHFFACLTKRIYVTSSQVENIFTFCD